MLPWYLPGNDHLNIKTVPMPCAQTGHYYFTLQE
jgi:hypothetical protein